ncbi:hypothetical protein P170DRAFT_470996 [Aspergillus steynii IBT 23096]|uniref:Uncharacterized protein n=1 Tax=Aspergillus steynii IBT 23096 TaxID=1392250 RepID=A0A2I2GRT7_9EURO|nr:uncharacterized protein P170DRAFT_470996 [Aspergillus steynii IBT 23096]PLB55584.1 hypothetical protein P170DRAFT_470996 [Aspergillus steynii IBT 23096]
MNTTKRSRRPMQMMSTSCLQTKLGGNKCIRLLRLERYENERKLLEKYLEKGKCTVGCVRAASGLEDKQAKDPHRVPSILDWALVRPLNHLNRAVGTNKIASVTSGPSSLTGFEVRELQADELLGKVGYVTGLLGAITLASGQSQLRPGELPLEDRGDSGSLVFDPTGIVLGMCFGGTETGDLLYFTHIGDVLESIREVTGVRDIRLRA